MKNNYTRKEIMADVIAQWRSGIDIGFIAEHYNMTKFEIRSLLKEARDLESYE